MKYGKMGRDNSGLSVPVWTGAGHDPECPIPGQGHHPFYYADALGYSGCGDCTYVGLDL